MNRSPPDLSRRGLLRGSLAATYHLVHPGRLIAAPISAPARPDLYPPIVPSFPHVLHGGDWNPEQWLHEPGIMEEDFRLMAKAGCNTFSIGIFAWSQLEPAEGRYTLDWLDRVLDGLAARGWLAFLATPSGAKPRWLSEKYPEVRRGRLDTQHVGGGAAINGR